MYNAITFILFLAGIFGSYWKPNFPAVSGSYLPGFSGRICSYWQPNFPAVSGSYLPGFSSRICRYWQPNFPAVFQPYLLFLAEKLYGQQANCSGIYSGIFWP
jgi:hypothetical protein